MVGPDEGERHWGMMKYNKINVEKTIEGSDVFCDEVGKPNEDLPSAKWLYEFTTAGVASYLKMTTTYVSPQDLQNIMDMGMEQGITQALDQLETVLHKDKT